MSKSGGCTLVLIALFLLLIFGAFSAQAQGNPAYCVGAPATECPDIVNELLPALRLDPVYTGQRALLQYMVSEKLFEAWTLDDDIIYHIAVIQLDDATYVFFADYNSTVFEANVYPLPEVPDGPDRSQSYG